MIRTRNTARVVVGPVNDYTFDELITHLHDHHGYTAEEQADDEVMNKTDPEIVANIRAMSREEAINRLPYHYFQGSDVPDSLESARIQHSCDHGDNPGGGGLVHFHPKAW